MASDTLTFSEAVDLARDLYFVSKDDSRLVLREVLRDLPPADIDVIRGLIAITERRVKDAGQLATV